VQPRKISIDGRACAREVRIRGGHDTTSLEPVTDGHGQGVSGPALLTLPRGLQALPESLQGRWQGRVAVPGCGSTGSAAVVVSAGLRPPPHLMYSCRASAAVAAGVIAAFGAG
jgi:hypothetical protein